MPQTARRHRSSRKKTVRWVAAAVVLCSTMSCIAPVLYASDCSRWIAEYKQGILQRRAARRLRAAKFRLTALVGPQHPVHHYPMRHPMGPLEALRRFQIDCGDLETPELAPKLPALPVLAAPLMVEFPEAPPPELPVPAVTEVAEATIPPLTTIPPLATVPITTTPVEFVNVPGPVPEPASWMLVLTGAMLAFVGLRRSARQA